VAHVSRKLSTEHILGHDLRLLPLFDFRVITKCSDFNHRVRVVFWPPEEAHFLEYFFVVFRSLKLDNRVPLGLVDVSPDLRSVVVYIDIGLLNNLLSDLDGSHVVFGETVKVNGVD